jgi:hypothetical protein
MGIDDSMIGKVAYEYIKVYGIITDIKH